MLMRSLEPIPLAAIEAARDAIRDLAVRTPLVRLNVDDAPAEIYLKLENLQPIGSFKLRGAGNALASVDAGALQDGVFTASAGNMAQGVAWVARERGVSCSVVVPDHAPATKLAAIDRLGATVVKIPFDAWWDVLVTHEFAELSGHFIHPVCDPAVIAGNGTIGLEILEDLPDVDEIIVPYGGGGLSSGIACAVRAHRPDIRVLAAEVETAAPLAASLRAGEPTPVSYEATFVDGIGSRFLLAEMWPLVHDVLEGSIVVSVEQIAAALRTMVERNRVVAEGAGAASVAAALTRHMADDGRKTVCVVSGGNIDTDKLATILAGRLPR